MTKEHRLLRRLSRVEIRVNEAEYDLVAAVAARHGMAVATWARLVLLGAARAEFPVERVAAAYGENPLGGSADAR